MAETRVDSVTQTDHEPHDVFYYKSRAFKAETALLTLRKDQYFHHLDSNLKENEKETSSKLLLYSYDPDKYRQLQMDFQAQTMLTEHLKKKACDILDFNLRALNDGHELSELPLIDDDTVDLATFRLGPVTPTLAGVPGQPLFLPYPPETQENVANYSSFFGATGSNQNMVLNSSNTLMNGFDQPAAGIFKEAGQPSLPFGASHTPYDFNLYCDVRSEKLADLDYAASRQQTNAFRISRSNPLNSSALARPPDVVPNTLVRNTTSSPSSSGSMGLDSLDLDFNTPIQKNFSHQKWSQIAAGGTDSVAEDGDWQAVGSKKPRPPSYQQMSQSFNHLSILQPHSPLTNSSNFETMVSVLQEKYLLSRPEVIAALQVVRQERNGDMNIPLTELVKDTERLLSKNKNILKPASLTARAKAVPDHEEPCENQLCPARLKQLKYRTELCLSYQTTGKCHMKPGSCVYAHGESEKRPLPKDELCERYLEGKCNNRRCVYAHGASELKNRPIVSTLEYIKTKQKKAIPDKKKPPQEDLSLLESDIDPLGEECSICLDKMAQNSRQKLDCGHDAFHYKCLKKWVAKEGDRSCPLCRSNTLLPEEYPHLGCH